MTRAEYMAGLIDAIERGQAAEYRAAFPWPEPEAVGTPTEDLISIDQEPDEEV